MCGGRKFETLISVAEAVLHHTATLVPHTMVSEVVAVAKRNLAPGETVGDIGGPDVFHRINRYEEAKALRGIPMGLATGGRTTRAIVKGDLLTQRAISGPIRPGCPTSCAICRTRCSQENRGCEGARCPRTRAVCS